MGVPRHTLSPSELAALLEAERQGVPFLAYRDGVGDFRIEALDGLTRVAIGRSAENDIELGWDPEVSRTHAQLELVGGDWTLVDDGLSRNGSFVNGERVRGRRRLDDADSMRLGHTSLVFRAARPPADSTAVADPGTLIRLTAGERRVLVSLCRPLAEPGAARIPATNRQIADELHLSVAGVKTHIRALFSKLGVDDLPQYQKRTQLARRGLELGLVTSRDLASG